MKSRSACRYSIGGSGISILFRTGTCRIHTRSSREGYDERPEAILLAQSL